MKKLFISAVMGAALVSGCKSDRVKSCEIDGMFIQSASGTLAIGSIDIMASPNGQESAVIKYAEDTAWLSPSTKTHEVKILLTGTNSMLKVDAIVESICRAFVGAGTNTSHSVSIK